jgi:hypothetical protein
MKRNEVIVHEHKKGVKAVKYNQKPQSHIEPPAPRNPVAKNASAAIGGGAAGAHKDKKKAAKSGETKHKGQMDMAEGWRNRRDAYQRDYDSSVSGMGKRQSLAYQLDGGANDERHDLDEPEQPRREQPKGMYFYNVPADKEDKAREVGLFQTRSGKWYSPFENTRANMFFGRGRFWQPKNEEAGAEVGKITKVDPATKKATLTKADGSSMEVDSTALKPTPDGKMSMDTPDTDELKAGTAVVSTEDMMAPPNDSSSPIPGDNNHDEISKLLVHRLKRLAGL